MADASLKRFTVYGGGRWARTLVAVLRQVLSDDTEIVCVSKNCFNDVESWLDKNTFSNVRLVSDWDLTASFTEGVIVATSPPSHFELALQAARQGLPTLCEKPIVSSLFQLIDLLSLAEATLCPIGVHLEFLFAEYLQVFAQHIRPLSVRSIRLDWLDPWCEERQGSIKYGEFYSDIVSDQLPHCWSVLTAILPEASGLLIKDISYSAARVELRGTFGVLPVSLILSRRAPNRVRRVTVTDDTGVDTALDFTSEPGFINAPDQAIVYEQTSKTPLASSLTSFVDVARGRHQRSLWPLELKNCFEAVDSALRTSGMLKAILDKQIDRLLLDKNIDLDNSELVHLIVDRFLPEFSPQGRRFSVHTSSQQKSFARAWFSSVR